MVQLEKVIYPSGIGTKVKATLLQRKGDLCLYERDDEVYEVFFVKVSEAGEIFGKYYPEREVYPNNEDFGSIAWCFKNKDAAIKKFDRLSKR